MGALRIARDARDVISGDHVELANTGEHEPDEVEGRAVGMLPVPHLDGDDLRPDDPFVVSKLDDVVHIGDTADGVANDDRAAADDREAVPDLESELLVHANSLPVALSATGISVPIVKGVQC